MRRMTVEEKLKTAALRAAARGLLRPPIKNPARVVRNLTELTDTLAGGLSGEKREALKQALGSKLREVSGDEGLLQQVLQLIQPYI